MTRTTSVALGFSAAAAALSLSIINSSGVASAATPTLRTALPAALRSSVAPAQGITPVATVAPARPSSHRVVPARAPARRTYTVESGDSFWSIAKNKAVDWYNLAADNHLQMYTVLNAGQVLTLPAVGEKAHAPMPLTPTAGAVATGTSSIRATTPTASTASAGVSGGSGFEQCVISRESGGQADVTNGGGYWGLFQFSSSTWSSYGGNPADFGRASAGEQEQVFDNAVAAGGESNWAPYDGC